jgi:hypothetical protein
VVVLLYNAGAMVRVASVRPTGFWGQWCRFVVEVVVVGRNGCVVDVVVDEGPDCVEGMVVAEVVVDEGFRRAELRASAPADGGYRGCIASLQASLAPC